VSTARIEFKVLPLHHIPFSVEANEAGEIIFVPPGLEVTDVLAIASNKVMGIVLMSLGGGFPGNLRCLEDPVRHEGAHDT
jgi:hypothetical protein